MRYNREVKGTSAQLFSSFAIGLLVVLIAPATLSAQTTLEDVTKSTIYTPGNSSSASTVSLSAEGVTYTPPFYRGRALPSADAPVRIHADAQFGGSVPASSVNYTWTINTRVMQNLSGLGKSDLLLSGASLYGTMIVSVAASAGSLHGSQTIRIPAVTPKVVLYNDDPLLGMRYHTAIDATTPLHSSETTLVAEPYFFAVSSPVSSDLIYKWSVNGSPVLSDQDSPARITLNVDGGGEATASVGLTLSSTQFSFETAKQTFQVHITPSSGSTPFTNTK